MGTSTQGAVFLSHSSHNDAFVAALHTRLRTQGFTVLEDSEFPAGDVLRDSVQAFIEQADHVIGIVSPQAAESGWVKRELRHAQQIAGQRDGFRIIPLLLPPAGTTELRKMFDLPEPKSDADVDEWPAELIAIEVADGAGAIDALLPVLLDALQRAGEGTRTASGPVARCAGPHVCRS